jgi:hypothetical protein
MPREGTVQETRGRKSPDDRGVALYHVVFPHEGFDPAHALFRLVRRAQDVTPGARHMLVLDIEGHRQPMAGSTPTCASCSRSSCSTSWRPSSPRPTVPS